MLYPRHSCTLVNLWEVQTWAPSSILARKLHLTKISLFLPTSLALSRKPWDTKGAKQTLFLAHPLSQPGLYSDSLSTSSSSSSGYPLFWSEPGNKKLPLLSDSFLQLKSLISSSALNHCRTPVTISLFLNTSFLKASLDFVSFTQLIPSWP